MQTFQQFSVGSLVKIHALKHGLGPLKEGVILGTQSGYFPDS